VRDITQRTINPRKIEMNRGGLLCAPRQTCSGLSGDSDQQFIQHTCMAGVMAGVSSDESFAFDSWAELSKATGCDINYFADIDKH
jgi:hypothetical protein